MPVIQDQWIEGSLTFDFPANSMASKYDDWAHYRKQVQLACGGHKAVDLVYICANTLWLIEVKDYRNYPRTKVMNLADEVALKVRDTLAGLVSAHCHASDADERKFARKSLRCKKIRVVCHLEQPAQNSRLRPTPIDLSKVQLKLRTLLKCFDPHPAVVDRHSLQPTMDWQVT